MIAGYHVASALCKTAGSTIFRAHRQEDAMAVLLKVLDLDDPIAIQPATFRREFDVLRSVNGVKTALPIALLEQDGYHVMVMSDFSGRSLESLIGAQQIDVATSLAIGGLLAAAVAELHALQIIHNDFRPANILVSPELDSICLIDLSHATSHLHEAAMTPRGGVVDSDLAYQSPEQTGRMNRGVDYRTDFYSLGIILYRMLTGVMPFRAAGPLEWAHCHIAREPMPMRDLAPGVPQTVCDIVMKLLAKGAENRYQSAQGLQHDLAQCLAQWQTIASVLPFDLGSVDISHHFQASTFLYGREKDAAVLAHALSRVAETGRPELALVSGYSGIGKSSLVLELHQPVVRQRGLFASCKFEQYQRDTPYATIADAFRQLVHHTLSQSEKSIDGWRLCLQEALGINGKLIVDLIPQLGIVLGPQADVAELASLEARLRFQAVFRRFAGTFLSKEQPLVLFLDDLQWADAASLGLITDLLTHASIRHLLVIGAYRDNEVTPEKPVFQTIQALRDAIPVLDIWIGPLSIDLLCRVVADTLHCAPVTAAPLATLIQRKTDGNPFFVNQFLRALHADKLVWFDPDEHRWCWNMADLNAARITDNVADLMTGHIERFDPASQQILRLAACLGHQFDLLALARIAGQAPQEIAEKLWPAVQQGFLVRVFSARSIDDGLPATQVAGYRWSHDRMQQSVYSLIDVGERSAMHLAIGRLLLAGTPIPNLGEQLFEVASHLNLGAVAMNDAVERHGLAELNLAAALGAKRATAYAAAREHAALGVAMLSPDIWQSDYGLALSLHRELAEAEHLCERQTEAEIVIERALLHARCDPDRADLLMLRVVSATSRRDYASALKVGLDALRLCGVALPADPTSWAVASKAANSRVRARLQEVEIDDLFAWPLIAEPQHVAAANLLARLMTAAYSSDPRIFTLLTVTLVELSLEHGHTAASAYGYAWFAVLGQRDKESYERARHLGRLARHLIDRFQRPEYTAKVRATILLAIDVWHEPLDALIAALANELAVGVDYGDLQYVGLSIHMVSLYRLASGEHLSRVADEIAIARRFAKQSANDMALRRLQSLDRAVAVLRGLPPMDSSIDMPSQDWVLDIVTAVVELRRCVLFGEFQKAVPLARRLAPMRLDSYMAAEVAFYPALVAAALFAAQDQTEREATHALLQSSIAKLTSWSARCPANFLHKQLLLSAEVARLDGEHALAISLYLQAITAAAQYGFMHIEALAAERAAHACNDAGLLADATGYLYKARASYAAWGAVAKVQQIDAGFARERDQVPAVSGNLAAGRLDQLDFLTVVKASQALSGKIVLEQLLDTLMRSVIEIAGAQTCLLLLDRGVDVALVAEARVEKHGVHVQLHAQQAVGDELIPTAIVNYARRSGQRVLLDDAAAPSPYSDDTYVATHHLKSVLCLPIVRQSELVGLLYLENNLVTHAFTSERLGVLEMLASQAAISIDNARLYNDLRQENTERRKAEDELKDYREHLEQLVEKRTVELRQANQELLQTNRQLGRAHTQLQQTEKRIRYLAQHDVLTGLPNRALLQERIELAIERANDEKKSMALFFIDLDNFKRVNDSLGHVVGDELLRIVAKRLQKCVRKNDTVARLGGDEFVICVTGFTQGDEAAAIAQKVLNALDAPFCINMQELHAGGSIGISLFPTDGTTADMLMQTADTAMYHAKGKGRGNFQFFTSGMNMAVQHRVTSESQLRQALQREEFTLQYQPQVDIATGRIVSAEALIRWHQPIRGLIGPDEFIPLAEETGLILAIGEWVLRQACMQLRRWHETGYPDLGIAVNLSALQLLQPGFTDIVIGILKETGLPATSLELEITESILMQPNADNMLTLATLAGLGIRLSVDDFGTGYSSLAYLKRFPIIHSLKIDRSFVKGVELDESDIAIATTIITMAKNLHLQVIGEGVETLGQASFLVEQGCLLAQGFYYSRAIDADDFTQLLRSTTTNADVYTFEGSHVM